MPDLFDIYDKHRVPTGKTVLRGTSLAPDEYRIVVHVWIQNPTGQWLISKRAANKSQPLKWEPPGGCVLSGETSLQAAVQEVREELGISLNPEEGILFSAFRRSAPSWENPGFMDIWVFPGDFPSDTIALQPGETCDARWASPAEILTMISAGAFVPTSEYAYHSFLLNGTASRHDVRIARIQYMESILDRVLSGKDAALRSDHLAILESYYHGPLWQEDYAADEAGLLPSSLKRGVLSQDTLYDLLTHSHP